MSRTALGHRKVKRILCWKVTSLLLHMKSIGLNIFKIDLQLQKEVKDISIDCFLLINWQLINLNLNQLSNYLIAYTITINLESDNLGT